MDIFCYEPSHSQMKISLGRMWMMVCVSSEVNILQALTLQFALLSSLLFTVGTCKENGFLFLFAHGWINGCSGVMVARTQMLWVLGLKPALCQCWSSMFTMSEKDALSLLNLHFPRLTVLDHRLIILNAGESVSDNTAWLTDWLVVGCILYIVTDLHVIADEPSWCTKRVKEVPEREGCSTGLKVQQVRKEILGLWISTHV